MIRILVIIGALIIGVGSLLMSVCGGIFFLGSVGGSGADPGVRAFAGICLALGGVACWLSFRFAFRQMDKRGDGDRT